MWSIEKKYNCEKKETERKRKIMVECKEKSNKDND